MAPVFSEQSVQFGDLSEPLRDLYAFSGDIASSFEMVREVGFEPDDLPLRRRLLYPTELFAQI